MQRHLLPVFILVVLFLTSSVISGTETAYPQTMRVYNCPGSNALPTQRSMHVEFFEQAVLAALAYEPLGKMKYNLRKSCPMGIPKQVTDTEVEMGPVPNNVLMDAISRNRDSNRSWIVDLFTSDSEEKFVTCTTDRSVTERLAVAFRYAFNNDRLSLLMKFAILGVSALSPNEEIGIVELKNAKDDKILGIQGTDMFKHKQWRTTINKLLDEPSNKVSCLFPFAVDITTAFFGNSFVRDKFSKARYYGIVGHSLGGAVAQHVAQDSDLATVIHKLRSDATFRVYSFNSIGVEVKQGSVTRQGTINSVRVAGEILEQLRSQFKRRQIGHIIRYGTFSDGLREGIRRHSIESVKEEICWCLTDKKRKFESGYIPW